MNYQMLPQNTKLSERLADRPHILVVDDDDRIRDLVARYLTENGFVVATTANAAEAREAVAAFSFDALVVDVMMPGETGLEFTQYLRTKSDLPVLLLTALSGADDRINGFETGADDYLPKPFEPRELVLRLQAILRRKPRLHAVDIPVHIGEWVFNPGENVLDNGTEIHHLTMAESMLIKALIRHSGQVISREDLVKECEMEDIGERTIDVQVTRLRRKLGDDAKMPRFLQTVRGKGYLLRVDD